MMWKRGVEALALITLCSCSTTMDLEYAFELERGTPDNPLAFGDGNFDFDFVATRSGVFFKVSNLSETAAYLD